MKTGMPYRNFGPTGIDLKNGAHDLAPRIPGLDPGKPLWEIEGQGPWSNWGK